MKVPISNREIVRVAYGFPRGMGEATRKYYDIVAGGKRLGRRVKPFVGVRYPEVIFKKIERLYVQ